MNKKILIIILFIIVFFVIIYFLINIKSSSNVQTSISKNIQKITYKDLKKNFIEINNVDFFQPYLINVNFSDISGGPYPIVQEIKFLGFYFDNDKKLVYVLENNNLIKYDIKELISQRYYILKVSNYQLKVLDTSEGTIKLIISDSNGRNELW